MLKSVSFVPGLKTCLPSSLLRRLNLRIHRWYAFLVFVVCSGCVSYPQVWQDYKATFIEDGRVLDTGNDFISHSEGQGYGMLLALHYNDQSTFEEIWEWTQNKLQVRDDHLFAWLWAKNEEDNYQVLDTNNATDGDLLIALALTKAGKHWNEPDYIDSATAIADSILEHLLEPIDQQNKVLLPAVYGFKNNSRIAWNPSYQILSAYDSLAAIHQKPQWQALKTFSQFLLNQSLDRESRLPADWISLMPKHPHLVSTELPHWPSKRNYFGDEAIRVYLYQLWQPRNAALLEPEFLFRYFERHNQVPRYMSGTTPVSDQEAMAGYYAILSSNAKRLGYHKLAKRLFAKANGKFDEEKHNYYSHTLYLLAINADQQGVQ